MRCQLLNPEKNIHDTGVLLISREDSSYITGLPGDNKSYYEGILFIPSSHQLETNVIHCLEKAGAASMKEDTYHLHDQNGQCF